MSETSKPRIVAVVGSTASGKTALAVELARRYGGEVVSCDSMQLYRGMDIGTAKPDEAERRGVLHHLFDIVDPVAGGSYSCADYVRDARAAVEDILSRGRLPILCGGTGLYLDAFLRGGSFEVTDTDPTLRAALMDLCEREGAEALHAHLAELDPESAATIHPNNVKRVIRAIEICRTTGQTKSELDRRSRLADSPYNALVIGLGYRDRAILYDRIDRRVDAMLAAGLVEETRRLRSLGVFEACPTAAQAIGYKELFPYLDGEQTLAEAAEILKMATRRYAKRQMTWFLAKPYVSWIECCAEASDDSSVGGLSSASLADLPCSKVTTVKSFEEIVNIAEKLFRKEGICDIL